MLVHLDDVFWNVPLLIVSLQKVVEKGSALAREVVQLINGWKALLKPVLFVASQLSKLEVIWMEEKHSIYLQ